MIITPTDDAPPSLVGGKAANLALLGKLGVRVPKWICLATPVFERASRAIGLETISEEFRGDSLRKGRLDASDEKALLEKFDGTFSRETLVAVRSSAIGEDSQQDSFAGQLDSFLFVRRESLVEKVLACFASAYSPRALVYRRVRGIRGAPAVAVLVQEMVASKAAGVLFTANPATGDTSEAVVSAALGLGEGVVADRVEADTYRCELATGVVKQRDVVVKRARVVFDATSGQGTRVETIDVSAPVLDDAQLVELVGLGRTIANSRGSPQDIEWALDERGLHILQTRPITTLRPGRETIFDSSNIVESYPGLSKPLTYSFARAAYEATFRQASRSFGVPEVMIERNWSVHSHLVAYVFGRITYDILNFYRLMLLVPGFTSTLPAWEKALGLQKTQLPRVEVPGGLRPKLWKWRVVSKIVGHFVRLTVGSPGTELEFAL